MKNIKKIQSINYYGVVEIVGIIKKSLERHVHIKNNRIKYLTKIEYKKLIWVHIIAYQ